MAKVEKNGVQGEKRKEKIQNFAKIIRRADTEWNIPSNGRQEVNWQERLGVRLRVRRTW